ncbi:MAG: DUF72 domain-containing protein [Candidatus Hodarchaeales archaeon]
MIYIGCAGWNYPHWRGLFYPRGTKDELEYYSRFSLFNEINNSYYRIPTRYITRKWFWQTPEDFIFSAKLVKDISHASSFNSKRIDLLVHKFFTNMSELELKFQTLVIQFPHYFQNSEKNFNYLIHVLRECRSFFKRNIVIEFRNKSWITKEVKKLLNKYKIQVVDTQKIIVPQYFYSKAPYYYLRLLGSRKVIPDDKFGIKILDRSQELVSLAKKINDLSTQYHDIFIVINNRFSGYAINDAILLHHNLSTFGLKAMGFKDREKYISPRIQPQQRMINEFF